MRVRDLTAVEVPLIPEIVLEQLRARLTDGTFPPGARMNIKEIAGALGVSIVPVREAIKVLQTEGRVIRDRSRSYRVRRLSFDELAQMNQLSSYLELELIKAGVPKLSDADVKQMRSLNVVVSGRSGDQRDVLERHRELHFVTFEAADKAIFFDNVRRLWDHYEHYRLLFFDNDPDIEDDASVEHRDFVEACALRDVEAAVEIHQRHRTNSFVHLSSLAAQLERDSLR